VVVQTLLQYSAMQVGIFDLLEAHRMALDLELELVETVREYWSTKAGLDALLAGRMVMMEGMRARARPRSMSGSGGGH
jgi:outer membrane protein TolC